MKKPRKWKMWARVHRSYEDGVGVWVGNTKNELLRGPLSGYPSPLKSYERIIRVEVREVIRRKRK